VKKPTSSLLVPSDFRVPFPVLVLASHAILPLITRTPPCCPLPWSLDRRLFLSQCPTNTFPIANWPLPHPPAWPRWSSKNIVAPPHSMAAALLGSGGWWDNLWPCYSCCRKIWIPSSGQFSPQCLGVVAHIPFWVAILTVTLRYGLGPAWSAYRPIWLRKFNAEQDALSSTVPDQESGAGSAGRKAWTAWTLSLFSLTGAAAAVGAIGALAWPEHAQLCLTSVIPCVSHLPPTLSCREIPGVGADGSVEDHLRSHSAG
jgi:hypothetical protein